MVEGRCWWQDGGRITELCAVQGLAYLNSVGDGAGAAEVTISQVPAGMQLMCTPQNVGCKWDKPDIGHSSRNCCRECRAVTCGSLWSYPQSAWLKLSWFSSQGRAAAGSISHKRLIALGKAFELCKCKRCLLDEEKLGSSQRDSRHV